MEVGAGKGCQVAAWVALFPFCQWKPKSPPQVHGPERSCVAQPGCTLDGCEQDAAAGGCSPASVLGVMFPTQVPSGVPLPPSNASQGMSLLELSSSLNTAGGPRLGSRRLPCMYPSELLWWCLLLAGF